MHDQIQKKTFTVDHLKEDDTIPRSLQFKFELQVPATSPQAIQGFQNQCNEALRTSQNAIKQVIVAACTQELQEIQLQQGQLCATFLCNAAKAFLLVNDHYNNANIVAVCAKVMVNPAVSPVFSSLDTDTRLLELQKWFPDVGEDNPNADVQGDPSAVALIEFLTKVVEKCLHLPIKKYNKAKKRCNKLSALHKLNASILVTKKTEDTVMQLDNEPTISPKLLDQMISEKVKKETARVLKNNTRGASSTSLKNKLARPHPNTANARTKQKMTACSSNVAKEPPKTGSSNQNWNKAHIPLASGKPKNITNAKNNTSRQGKAQMPSSTNASGKKSRNRNSGMKNNSGKQQS